MTGTLDGNDKKAVHKIVRHLIKHGTWERHGQRPGKLESITCGPVKIEGWNSSWNVTVFANGFEICNSNSDYGSGGTGRKANLFFAGHYNRFRAEHEAAEYAKARLALLRAQGESS